LRVLTLWEVLTIIVTMKGILFILALSFMMASCGSTETPNGPIVDSTVIVNQDTTHVQTDSTRADSVR
jgi:hypothetical protein